MGIRKIAKIVVAGLYLVMATGAQGKARQADFNGDGAADLAIGVEFERVAGFNAAGGVAVIYGKRGHGLSASGDQFWTLDSAGVNGEAAFGTFFGGALAAGDFDGDGFTDLAISAQGEAFGATANAGYLHILYGSSHGLSASGDQRINRGQGDLNGAPTTNEYAWRVLASGDFNHDGFDDLAAGTDQATVNGMGVAGDVQILYGSHNGLKLTGDQLWTQDSPGVNDSAEVSDRFGAALAVGDFDGDHRDDLAIGVPEEGLGVAGAGAVHVLYGSSSGLTANGTQFFSQGTGGVREQEELNDYFGSVLAAGDFDHNGKDDLAIGVPDEDIDGVSNAGAVHVLYGSSNGLRTDNDDLWTENTNHIPSTCEAGDSLGHSLAAGDFDHDGRDDLAMGLSGKTVNGKMSAGAVIVLHGGSNGLKSSGSEFWHQDKSGIKDKCDEEDYFGAGLTAGDYDDDGRDDLAIGVSYETVHGMQRAGSVNVIYGHSGGLNQSGNQFWNQDSEGINDSAATSEYFGEVLR
ncbi:MAG TPA: FG-GAP repeat protein [Phycisphaerales bacterium]|nr:FG-GAP repeat protein [Phycisphaerales bacterium]